MNKILTFVFILLLINVTLARRRSHFTKTDSSIVFTPKGALNGLVKDTHRVFYGVPFAQPPVDDYRWIDPIDVKEWKHIRDATQQKPECAQRCTLGEGACSPLGPSEDCLYLDVFTPRNANPESKLPVIVFIPGGAFSDLLSGNFGFLDQIKALEWVNQNIEAFGGDKTKVTIYGQSAGAFSVATHLVSPYSKPYFQAAILSSTPLTLGVKEKSIARGFAKRFNKHLGCPDVDDLECLRSKSMDEVLEAQSKVKYNMLLGDNILDAFTIWSPILDGNVIPKQPLTAIKDGETHDVPTIIGDVKDEGIIFINLAFPNGLSQLIYNTTVGLLFPGNKNNILSLYPGQAGDSSAACSNLMNDYLFQCPGRYHVNQLVAKHNSPVYHYYYAHVKSTGGPAPICDGNVCHGEELSLVFNSYELMDEDLDDDEIDMAQTLNNYIVNFATTHNPNQGIKVPTWEPVLSTKNRTLVIVDDFQSLDKTSNNPKCDLLDSTSYRGYTKVAQRSIKKSNN
ncbi:hypothetical protein DICPUDRAFT_80131 [Dictyostelium purpureum]|uniref:Carboxylic ester hydrolase n=1 Tax=Dictyostelium purpureum TaxID=5786 RepID=F0ZPM4_DICPU|nr:uncharacterized protein DICPUDRAFT_80131 [Dictyostelium purpureum]EGC34124.1 hypothetical protein DICPUDRAFT_80131 [Dictyostelium purpureum]|eukprot:XP_003289370.1 hypothetical protein DICPUDRAFT_80131 [Dictyostelium purpureum]